MEKDIGVKMGINCVISTPETSLDGNIGTATSLGLLES